MTRVEAYTDARRAIEMGQYRGQVLESMPHGTTLAGGMLEQDSDVLMRPRLEGARNRLGNQPQRVVFAARRTRSGVNDDTAKAQ